VLLSAAGLAAQPPEPPAPVPQYPAELPSLAALPITEPIRMDGALDEPAWQQAEVSGPFTQHEPQVGQPSTERTEVRVVYTKSTLYVGIRALASHPETIVAGEMLRDGVLYRDDSVIVLLDTFDDNRNAFFFETNVNGARVDALITDEGRDFNLQWDGVWDSAARRTPEGWEVEIAIPFATLRFASGTTWGFNVRRLIRAKSEETFWAPILLDANLFRVSRYGRLTGLENLDPGLNLRVKPFAVGSVEDLSPAGGDSEEDLDLGADVKWGITRNLSLDLTYNTDFAEAEVDDQQVNLTRFSLFFPEKREFFLENAGIFSFGPPALTNGTPLLEGFFSRRIGVGPFGLVVPIDWGVRLTGRVGDWNLGLADIQTDDLNNIFPGSDFSVPEDNWSVVRLKRNIGRRSSLGLLATNRETAGGDYNRVFGLDGNFNLTKDLRVGGYYSQSDDPGRQRDDWAGGVEAAWSGRVTDWSFAFNQIGDDYNPESGFLLRRGIRHYQPTFYYQPRPEMKGVRNLIFGAFGDVFTDTHDELETVDTTVSLLGFHFNGDDEAILSAGFNYEKLNVPFNIFPGVVIPPGEYHFNEAGISFSTNTSRRLAVNGVVSVGDFFDGKRTGGFVSLGVRASRFLRTDTTWSFNDVELPGGAFTTNVVRQRIGVSFTPDLSANTYLQYNDANELLSVNLRINWIYRPGSDLFLVFNQNWAAPSLSNLDREDRAVILKTTYMLQF
jgi:hypothetical protein